MQILRNVETVKVHRIPGKEDTHEDKLQLTEFLRWIESNAWYSLMFFTVLFWINGPSVSTSQWYSRCVFWTTSGLVAAILRIYSCYTCLPVSERSMETESR
jgi:hypothetical protein